MSSSHSVRKVLFVGQEPETVDFSDPALPPGLDAAKIRAGIAMAMQQMAARGWHVDLCLLRADASAVEALESRLRSTTYDCVVIGAGIRVPPKSLLLFETLLNVVHRAAPASSIAFNTTPQDTADAAARWFD